MLKGVELQDVAEQGRPPARISTSFHTAVPETNQLRHERVSQPSFCTETTTTRLDHPCCPRLTGLDVAVLHWSAESCLLYTAIIRVGQLHHI